MRRKRTPKSRDMFDRSHRDDLDLADAPDSDLANFGDTATRGFSDAWDDATSRPEDDDVSQFGSDPDDTSGRDLDRTSKKGVVALALIVLIGAGLGYAVQSGRFDQTSVDEQSARGESAPLLSPEDIRIYEAEPTSIELEFTELSTGLFVESGANGPEPVDPDVGSAPALPGSIGGGPVLWAGRLHVAVFANGIGAGLQDGELCSVVSLTTEQLAGIDVAAHGSCDSAFDATGDRLACMGDDLVLIEVWSDDPSSVGEPPPAAFVRFRVETAATSASSDTADAGDTFSRRGTLMIPVERDLLEVAADLGGAPGDVVSLVNFDGSLDGTCILIDRSDINVKLLPS